MIKNKNPGGSINHQRKEIRVGEEENRRSLFSFLACSPMFSKRTKNVKKNITTSVYGLLFNSHKKNSCFLVQIMHSKRPVKGDLGHVVQTGVYSLP